MAVLPWSPNLFVQVGLEVKLASVFAGLDICLDLGKVAKDVKTRIEIGLGRVLLVGGVTLPFKIWLNCVNELDGFILAQRHRFETFVSKRRCHSGGR
jgi:hypothetical protein